MRPIKLYGQKIVVIGLIITKNMTKDVSEYLEITMTKMYTIQFILNHTYWARRNIVGFMFS